MTDDASIVAVRFVLYMALGAAFGLTMFAVPARPVDAAAHAMRRHHRQLVVALAVVGLVASTLGMLVLAKSMAGAETWREAVGHAATMVAAGLPVGVAWVVRMIALVACLVLGSVGGNHPGSRVGTTAASGVALASLAWSGHGAMHDGAEGVLHLAADVSHLWAAGAWIGALVAFLVLAVAPSPTRDDLGLLAAAAEGYARTGTIVVAVLVATGVVNIAGTVEATSGAWSAALGTLYGKLLLIKLALFAGMLSLAAANRYRLSPRLSAARRRGDALVAARLLRTSLAAETALALLVLGTVAWLGTLSPIGN